MIDFICGQLEFTMNNLVVLYQRSLFIGSFRLFSDCFIPFFIALIEVFLFMKIQAKTRNVVLVTDTFGS